MAKFPIQVDVGQPRGVRSRRKRHQLITVATILGLLALVLLWMGLNLLRSRGKERAESAPPRVTNPLDGQVAESRPQTAAPSAAEQALLERQSVPQTIADDGRTLWASPTSGKPLDLAFLPPGCQIFFALRPADLLSHPEGEKVLAAVGPEFNSPRCPT